MAEQVSIITTTYRNYDKLKRCLADVTSNTKFVDYKHYVWCNDPDEQMKEIIHDSMFIEDELFTDRIEPIFHESNTGSFASNNNLAAKEAGGKYLLFLNDDCYPLNDEWLYSMVRILETDERVGAVGPLLLYADQKTIQHCGVFFSQRTNNLPFHMHYKQPLEAVAGFVSVPRYYQAVTGACLLVRAEEFRAVGGFEELYWYCYEDIDLCLKIKNQFHKSCVFTPTAQLIHDEGVSSKPGEYHTKNIDTFKGRMRGKYMNDLEFYQANPSHMIYRPK
jgi:GT2 family glycosyltransferase